VRQDICKAIQDRRQLQISYDGGKRVIEPYVYGACEARELLRAYQLSGFSRSRKRGWKLFRVEDIAELKVLKKRFVAPHEGYMRNDPCMEIVYSEI